MPEFALVAADGCIPLDVLAFMAAAINEQMTRDVAPIFGGEPWTCAALSSLDGVRGDPGIRKVLTFMRDIGTPGALGYHTEVAGIDYAMALPPAPDGSTAIDATTASHEVIETFGDPRCDLYRAKPDGSEVDYELCDAVEADSYTIYVTLGREVRAVRVSNFVTPAWFGAGNGKVDFLGNLTAPFEMSPGGYYRMVDRHGTEHYVYADARAKARVVAKLANATSRITRRGGKNA